MVCLNCGTYERPMNNICNVCGKEIDVREEPNHEEECEEFFAEATPLKPHEYEPIPQLRDILRATIKK